MPRTFAAAVPAGRLASSTQPTLKTSRGYIVRPFHAGDAPDVLRAFTDPDIVRWNRRAMTDLDQARAWIDAWLAKWQDETGAGWAVVDESGAMLGRVALHVTDLYEGEAEVGYWALPGARGRGVTVDAVLAITDWARADLGFHRLWLRHSTLNPASCAVAGKAGFTVEGIQRSALRHADGWHDMCQHARTPDA